MRSGKRNKNVDKSCKVGTLVEFRPLILDSLQRNSKANFQLLQSFDYGSFQDIYFAL